MISVSNEQPLSKIINQGPITKQQILIIVLCLVFNMLDGFDITAMAIVAKSVGQELGLSAAKLGWIFSFALAGMMAGAMVLAPIADIIGRRKMIILSLSLIGVSILFTANANSLGEFVVLRFISGLGAGALLTSQATLAAEYSPERFRSLAVVTVTAGYPLGAMMTSVVAGYVTPDFGWRGMFWFGGTLTVLMAIVAIALIPESLKYLNEARPANALVKINKILKRLNRAALSELPKREQTNHVPKGLSGNIKALIAPEHRQTTLLLWLAFFLSFATLYVLMSWIPKLVEDSGYSFKVGRDAFFWFNLGGVIGIFALGLLATRISLSKLLLVLLCCSAVGMIIFASLTMSLSTMMLLIFLIGLLLQSGFTGLYAAAAKAYPTNIRATGVGWCLGLGRSGAVIGPAVAGYLIAADLNMASIFYIFAVPSALAGIVGYQLKLK